MLVMPLAWRARAGRAGSETGLARVRVMLSSRELSSLTRPIRDRVVAGTSGLFAHGDDPLAGTLGYPGDPGLFGPASMTWRVIGDASVFAGGIRALLVQAAHPEVA